MTLMSFKNKHRYFIIEIVLRNDIPIVDMATMTFIVDICMGFNIQLVTETVEVVLAISTIDFFVFQ